MFAVVAAALVGFAAILLTLVSPSPLTGSGSMQNGPDAPEITEPECSFWFDYDTDGEGDEPLPDTYILQETSIVGGCSFRLKSPDEATIVVASELKNWEVEVEIKHEPGTAEDYKLYPGRPEIRGIQGSVRVIANFVQGDSPRSGKYRTLAGDYRHEVQIPQAFRLLEITVITPDGRKDRLELDAQSASGSFISSHQTIADAEGELPDSAITLAQDWLRKGYPQVADGVIHATKPAGDASGGGTNWWMWVALGSWGVLGTVIAAAIIFVLLNKVPREPSRGTGQNDL